MQLLKIKHKLLINKTLIECLDRYLNISDNVRALISTLHEKHNCDAEDCEIMKIFNEFMGIFMTKTTGIFDELLINVNENFLEPSVFLEKHVYF